jgi:hypothetical protein
MDYVYLSDSFGGFATFAHIRTSLCRRWLLRSGTLGVFVGLVDGSLSVVHMVGRGERWKNEAEHMSNLLLAISNTRNRRRRNEPGIQIASVEPEISDISAVL